MACGLWVDRHGSMPWTVHCVHWYVTGLTQAGLDKGTWCGTVLGVSKTTTTKEQDMNSIAKTVVTGLVGAGVGIAAITGIAVAVSDQGPDATAEFYGGEYAMDEIVTAAEMEASFYGDDNPGLNYAYADEIGVMDQSDFPCTEDEVLGYDPRFGPGMVGCINVESLI